MVSSVSRGIHAIGQAIRNKVHKATIAIGGLFIFVAKVIGVIILVLVAIRLFQLHQQHRPVEEDERTLAELRRRYQRERRQREQREAECKRKAEEERQRKEEQRQCQKQQEARRHAESDQRAYKDWRQRCDKFRDNRETMTTFPAPPTWPCTAAQPCNREILEACRHSIERLYRASGGDFQERLKEGKLEWHQDKFAKCRESCRQEMERKATEMFKIIGQLEAQFGKNFGSR